MRLLLDTHVLVWAMSEPARLSRRAHAALSKSSNDVFVSMASAWELSILQGLERLVLKVPIEALFTEGLARLRIRLVPIQLPHVAAVAGLPRHHRDPFDRLLIATALSEDLALVSADQALAPYGVHIVW